MNFEQHRVGEVANHEHVGQTQNGRAVDDHVIELLAREIEQDWKNVYFGARPYLDAMKQLTLMRDSYGYDSAKSIVGYFLANAITWRGEVARRVKKELNAMLKEA